MTETEEKVLVGMRRRRQALGRTAAQADYLAMLFSTTVRETKDALKALEARGLVGKTTANSWTPSWFVTTTGQEV
jgi:energy-coupling factor transporter transmembrane protein EcfT